MMAAIAALSSSVWADWTYEVDITHMESGTFPEGTIPVEIQLQLIDVARSGKVLATASVNFAGIASLSDYISGERFDVHGYLTANPAGGTFEVVGGTLQLSHDSAQGDKAQGRVNMHDSSNIFPGTVREEDFDDYAASNLRTVFTADEKSYVLAVKKSGSSTVGTTVRLQEIPPQPVPEPTGGMLALLGIVGLMLRRRRAA